MWKQRINHTKYIVQVNESVRKKNLNNKQQNEQLIIEKKIVYFLCAVISKEKKISLKREKISLLDDW